MSTTIQSKCERCGKEKNLQPYPDGCLPHKLLCEPCTKEHREAMNKLRFNLCTVCDKTFNTKKELGSHSHKGAV